MRFISAKSSYKSKCSAKVPPGVPLNRHRRTQCRSRAYCIDTEPSEGWCLSGVVIRTAPYMSGCCYTTWNWRWVLPPASVQCGVLLSWNTAHLDVISTCLDTATQHETGGECRPQHFYNVVYFCLETLLILTSSLHVWILLHNMKL